MLFFCRLRGGKELKMMYKGTVEENFFLCLLGWALIILGGMMIWAFAGSGGVEANRLAQGIGFLFFSAGVLFHQKGKLPASDGSEWPPKL